MLRLNQSLFLALLLLSISTVLPGFEMFRYTIMPRIWDLYMVIFFLLLKSSSLKISISRWVISFLVMTFLIACLIVSIFNFSLTFVVVEFRWIFIIFFVTLLCRCISYHDLERFLVWSFRYYFYAFCSIYLINEFFGQLYRPGVFGENNYDLGYLASVLLVYMDRGKFTKFLYFLVISYLSRSRAILILISGLMLAGVRKSRQNIFIILLFLIVISYSLSDRILVSSLDGIDRFVILVGFYDILSEDWLTLLFGQALTGACNTHEFIHWYTMSQYSREIGCVVPANFHGLVPRLIYLFGVMGMLAIMLHLQFIYVRFGLVVSIAFTVACMAQSVYANPFAGAVLLVTFLKVPRKKSWRLTHKL